MAPSVTSSRAVATHVVQLLGLAILGYLLAGIGLGRIAVLIAGAHPLPLVVAFALGLSACAARLYKLKLLLHGDPSAAHASEIFVAGRTGKELSQLGYFVPLLAPHMRRAAVLEALLADRYLETLATLVLALVCSFTVPALPWAWTWRVSFGLGLAAMGAVVILPFPQRAWRHASLQRIRERGRSVQRALRHALRDLGGVVALTLCATLLDFLAVGSVFMSLGQPPPLVYIPIVWAATAAVSVLTLTAYGPGDYSTVKLYQAFAGVPVESSAAMLVLGRGVVGLFTLGCFTLLGALMSRRERSSPLAAVAPEH